jgi:hypothetical protein
MALVRHKLPEKYERIWTVWTNGPDWNDASSADAAKNPGYRIGITVERVVVKHGNSNIRTVYRNSLRPGHHIDVHHKGKLICRIERKHSKEDVNARIKEMEEWITQH